MTEHIKTKHILKEDISVLMRILSNDFISDEDKVLLRLIYIDRQDFNFIADKFNVCEQTIKKRHRLILQKVSKIIRLDTI